jgi:hypothetical protein
MAIGSWREVVDRCALTTQQPERRATGLTAVGRNVQIPYTLYATSA